MHQSGSRYKMGIQRSWRFVKIHFLSNSRLQQTAAMLTSSSAMSEKPRDDACSSIQKSYGSGRVGLYCHVFLEMVAVALPGEWDYNVRHDGWVILRLNFRLEGVALRANIYGPLDGEMVVLQLCLVKVFTQRNFVVYFVLWILNFT